MCPLPGGDPHPQSSSHTARIDQSQEVNRYRRSGKASLQGRLNIHNASHINYNNGQHGLRKEHWLRV